MSYCTLKHTLFFILLSFFVDQGHGRWKPSRDKMQKDIALYKQMTKIIKQELEAYYDDKYSDDFFDDFYLGDNKYLDNQIYDNVEKNTEGEGENINSSPSSVNETLNEFHNAKLTENSQTNKDNILFYDKKWPKFEDILLEIGKKYDWKNDRWIKIKHKEETQTLKNYINHQKHNFIYRTVKLNRAKSKRNVVIAVTAVR